MIITIQNDKKIMIKSEYIHIHGHAFPSEQVVVQDSSTQTRLPMYVRLYERGPS
jgi:hypothetical protein